MGSGAVLAGLGPGLALDPQRAAALSSSTPNILTGLGDAGQASTMLQQQSEDPLVAPTVQIVENMEPVIPHPEQQTEVQQKLAVLEEKTGKKPNILIFLMDKEQYSYFGRQTFMDHLFSHPYRAHLATFVQYPSKKE